MDINNLDYWNTNYTHEGSEYSHDPMAEFMIDGSLVRAYTVLKTPMSEADAKTISYSNKIKNLRRYRDKIMSGSDWMSNSDSPTMTDAWTTYRQELRDLPSKYTSWDDFETFSWPTKPS